MFEHVRDYEYVFSLIIWTVFLWQARRNRGSGRGGGGGGRGVLQPSHIFAKIDLLPIDNDSKKKKVAKKYKPL